MYTFRAVLKDANFGDMFVGSYKPESIDNLFISIQTFNSQSCTEKTTSDFYDYIIVDEFHHAAVSLCTCVKYNSVFICSSVSQTGNFHARFDSNA